MMGWTQDRQRLEVWRLTECLCDHVARRPPNELRRFGLIEIYHYEI
jgi:hypothetical protein